MFSQRFDSLKSQTIPNMEGQDEESFAASENPYDLLAMTNSCPDLSALLSAEDKDIPVKSVDTLMEGVCNAKSDGNEFVPTKIPLSYRRSTSLNSIDADTYPRDNSNSVDGNVVGALQSGTVGKVVGKLEHGLNGEHRRLQNSAVDFSRSTQRSSYTGPGFFHKSVSSPSMQSFSPSAVSVGPKLLQLSQTKGESCTATTKRSFFRRKQKRKRSGNIKSDISREPDRMNGLIDSYQESLGASALSDTFLCLKEPDIDCWVKFMKPEVVARLTDKEIKRQEHMYEFILTEKHQCLTLALMHNLFLNDMKISGFGHEARLLFPGLTDLLQVHLDFFRRLKEKQIDFSLRDEPLDTLSDVLLEQFSGDQWHLMIRFYGLLCSSLEKAFELFKVMKQKDPRFGHIVASWNNEPLLGRKNVTECLLLVGQRITKYPLLVEPLIKTSICPIEKADLAKAWTASKELNARVNERVAERERLAEICSKIDPKSIIQDGSRRIRAHDLLSLPNRRLIFNGHAVVNRIISGNITSLGNCSVLILTDVMVCTQEVGGKVSFVSPPGQVILNQIIVRENAGHDQSLYLVMGSGSRKPEMIELQIRSPGSRQTWITAFKEAQILFEEESDLFSDFDEEVGDSMEQSENRALKGLDELYEQDKKLLCFLKARSKLIYSLRNERPQHWTPNSFEGKDKVLIALSEAASEVQKTLHNMDVNSNTVNRSASCVNEHVTSILGLPRRADTFAGFDSQQRTSLDCNHIVNNKILSQLVVQLAEVCGEMFLQMIPNLSLNISQNNHHLQRRMEELREAQQRFEAEKAQWNQVFLAQKEELNKDRQELTSLKEALQKQEIDISHQREQLYRKLEKLETQGIKPLLDSVAVSPISINTSFDKSVPGVTSRRSPSLTIQSSTPANPSTGSKQQLPLHLASSLMRSNTTSSLANSEHPKQLTRSTTVSAAKGSPNANSQNMMGQSMDSGKNSVHFATGMGRILSGASGTSNLQGVQQVLPLRLSEGLPVKAGSLPRGLASKSALSMTQGQLNPNGNQENRRGKTKDQSLHHSKSSTSIMMGNEFNFSNSSGTDRMGSYHRDSESYRRLGLHENLIENTEQYNGLPISHRRSGSSPTTTSTPLVQSQVRIPYRNFSQNDDDDSSTILFL